MMYELIYHRDVKKVDLPKIDKKNKATIKLASQTVKINGKGAARMGDKAEARTAMVAAGLPTIPGTEGILADVDQALAALEEVADQTLPGDMGSTSMRTPSAR